MYKRSIGNYDLNAARHLQNTRQASAAQMSAADALKNAAGAQDMKVRWNEFGGSPDVIYDFASQPFAGTPEEAGRAFISR